MPCPSSQDRGAIHDLARSNSTSQFFLGGRTPAWMTREPSLSVNSERQPKFAQVQKDRLHGHSSEPQAGEAVELPVNGTLQRVETRTSQNDGAIPMMSDQLHVTTEPVPQSPKGLGLSEGSCLVHETPHTVISPLLPTSASLPLSMPSYDSQNSLAKAGNNVLPSHTHMVRVESPIVASNSQMMSNAVNIQSRREPHIEQRVCAAVPLLPTPPGSSHLPQIQHADILSSNSASITGNQAHQVPPAYAPGYYPAQNIRTSSSYPPTYLPLQPLFSPGAREESVLSAAYTRFSQSNSLGNIDNQRFILLFDACKKQDGFYLLIHQLYCLRSTNPDCFSYGWLNPQLQALSVLEPMLVHNGVIGAATVEFFSHFPVLITELHHPALQELMSKVKEFLTIMASSWDKHRSLVVARRFPMCAAELHAKLGLFGPVLQMLLFTSQHRQIRSVDGVKWEISARLLFTDNRAQYVNKLLAGIPLDLNAEIEAFRRSYESVYNAVVGAQSMPSQIEQSIAQRMPPPVTLLNQPSREYASSQHMTLMQHPHRSAGISQTPEQFQTNTRYTPTQQTHVQVLSHPPQQFQPNVNRHPSHQNQFPAVRQSAAMVAHARFPANQNRYFNPPASPNSSPNLSPPMLNIVAQNVTNYCGTKRPLLPRAGFVLPQTVDPKSDRVALHQAHLRSPPASSVHEMDEESNPSDSPRLYQQMESFALTPKLITKEDSFQIWRLELAAGVLQSRVSHTAEVSGTTKCSVRDFEPGKVLLRLRSVEAVKPTAEDHVESWSALPTKWPECCFISLNTHADVQVRRKAHFGKDLAADITDLVLLGDNKMTVSVYWSREDTKSSDYVFAVEIVRICCHDSVRRAPSRISKEDSLSAMIAVLNPTTTKDGRGTDDDDDLMVIDPSISIDVLDPFMSVIWSTPVRGKHCRHRECFDLESFLLSRTSRQPGLPSDPDEWKCPICKSTAKPTDLIVDEFLLAVRQELEEKSWLHAKAIRIKENGTWVATLSDDDDDGIEDEKEALVGTKLSGADSGALISEGYPVTSTTRSNSTSGPIIIDLEDDDD